MDQNQEGIKAWQWLVTAIIIIILVILGYYMFKNKGESPYSDQTGTATSTPGANEINKITVADQYPGNVVYVSSAQLSNPGWIVVQKDNNGAPGAVIGKAFFDTGISNGRVTLTENTVNGSIYYAVVHRDNGDRLFDITNDPTVMNSMGTAVMQSFRATTNIVEIKG